MLPLVHDHYKRSKYMIFLRRLLGVILILATIAPGAYVDIALLLVPGIEEIIHAVQATPVSGSMVAWGVVHIVFSGVGIAAAALLSFFWGALLFPLTRAEQAKKVGVRMAARRPLRMQNRRIVR